MLIIFYFETFSEKPFIFCQIKSTSKNQKYDIFHYKAFSHVKLELGLETIYQMAGQFILLGLAYTETATNESFPMLFKKENIVLLVGSTIYSFISCVISHLTAISACRERFPFKSKLIASIYSFCGCTTRVLAIVMYFAVPLGLFNLLRHLQGEQYPWHDQLVYKFVGPDAIGNISVGNVIVDWSKIDRWVQIAYRMSGHAITFVLCNHISLDGVRIIQKKHSLLKIFLMKKYQLDGIQISWCLHQIIHFIPTSDLDSSLLYFSFMSFFTSSLFTLPKTN